MPSDSAPATILVLDQSTDRWFASAAALAEILHLEGINDLETGHLEDLTAAALEGRSLVLVAPADPAPEAVELLLEHVDAGGGLIAVAPGENFAERLALTHSFRGQM